MMGFVRSVRQMRSFGNAPFQAIVKGWHFWRGRSVFLDRSKSAFVLPKD